MKQFYLILAVLLGFCLIGCGSSKSGKETVITTPSGLKYLDLKQGIGEEIMLGKNVNLDYIIKTEEGVEVENSYKTKQPLKFKIGNDDVVKGLEEGVLTMKPGGKRRIWVPPDLGFGNRSVRNIPTAAVLIFDVEILEVE